MKHFKLMLWSSVLVAACLPAQAQDIARFKVPFDFTVRGTHLSAGEYIVSKVLSDSDIGWKIQNVVTSDGCTILTNSVQSPMDAHKISMVFRSHEGHYSLYQFWTDRHKGRMMQPSRDQAQYSQIESASAMTVVEIPGTRGN